MIATRTLWRYSKNTHPDAPRKSNSVIETFHKGDRCDWASGGVYEILGWAILDT